METRRRGGRHLQAEYELPNDLADDDSKLSRNENSRHQEKHLFPRQFDFYLIIFFVGIIFSFVKYMDNRLPSALTMADIVNYPKAFIEARARHDLVNLIQVGPRVLGSYANDIATVEILMKTLKEIQKTASPVHKIDIAFSKSTGVLDLGGFIASYASVPLVVVKFEAALDYRSNQSRTNDSVLVNCHFDSVPVSPGASDDMVSCVTMIEVLRVLSRQSKPFQNTVIFLFNGAEENGQEGSHGFIAGTVADGSLGGGHPWSKNIRAFFNMEAAGAGGREILFQTGPGNAWILQAYAKGAPHPFGSVMGEEIFQSRIIPSETDFRIFRDYAKIPGLDVAFIKNAWVYHTRMDTIDKIPPGSLQHIGSNSLGIIENLADTDFSEIKNPENERMVYFDLFGLYMITYSEATGKIINVVLGVVTVFLAWCEVGRSKWQLIRNVFATIVAWVAGIFAAFGVGIILDSFNFTMPYYSYPSLVYLIFGIPTLTAQILVYSLTPKHEDDSWIGAKTSLSILIIMSTFFTRAPFLITINIAFSIIGMISARYLWKDSQRRVIFYLIFGEAFPLAMSIYISLVYIDFFVPTMGRGCPWNTPNIFIGSLTAVLVLIPGFSGIVPIFVSFKKSFLGMAALVYVFTIALIVFGIGKNPYRVETPMRLHIADMDRTWFESDLKTVAKSDRGYWFFNMDPNVPNFLHTWTENVPEISRTVSSMRGCAEPFCAIPYFFPLTHHHIVDTKWIPKNTSLPAKLKAGVRMEVTKDEFLKQTRRRITLSFLGSTHLSINFSPGPNYDLVKWSLPIKIPKRTFWTFPAYFIFHSRGIDLERFEVTFEFERKNARDRWSRFLDINYSSLFIHGDQMSTAEMSEFMSRFPNWTHIVGWSSVTHIYTIK